MSAIDQLLNELARDAEEFRSRNPLPHAWYNTTGDALEVYLQEGPAIYEGINRFITVVVDRNDRKRILGFILKGITANYGEAIEKVDVFGAPGLVRILLYRAGELSVLDLRRASEAPPGLTVPQMSPDDIIYAMKNSFVQIANLEDLKAALA